MKVTFRHASKDVFSLECKELPCVFPSDDNPVDWFDFYPRGEELCISLSKMPRTIRQDKDGDLWINRNTRGEVVFKS